MSSTYKHKDAAWSFIRTRLLPQTEQYWSSTNDTSFFINKKDFQKSMEKVTTPIYSPKTDKDGNVVELPRSCYYFGYDDFEIPFEIYAISESDYDQLMELYTAVDTFFLLVV